MKIGRKNIIKKINTFTTQRQKVDERNNNWEIHKCWEISNCNSGIFFIQEVGLSLRRIQLAASVNIWSASFGKHVTTSLLALLVCPLTKPNIDQRL